MEFKSGRIKSCSLET